MAAIITEKFRLQNSAQFLESFSETNERYYMFIGKATPFTSGTSGGSDTAPPTPVDDVTSENYRWDSMIAANQIASSDVSRVVNRRTFVSGTTKSNSLVVLNKLKPIPPAIVLRNISLCCGNCFKKLLATLFL